MIRFTSVTKRFPPDDSGVKNVSFSIEPGEMLVLTGPSGSGKTTLLKLLLNEYSPEEGSIEFEDTDLSRLSSRTVHTHRRKFGVVFQDYRLLPELTIWENIALPLWITGQNESEIENRVTDLLELVSLTEKAFLFPRQLSGGEAQRISIARALANAPSVILADEPTGNLDEASSALITRLLHSINELGTTIIFATHDPKVLSLLADKRRLHLESGTLTLDTFAKKMSQTTKKSSKNDKNVEIKPKKEEIIDKDEQNEDKKSFWQKLFGKNKEVAAEEDENNKDESKKAEPTVDTIHREDAA